MVVHYPRERLRYNSERPAAICGVLAATGPGSYRSADIPLGVPTTSARTRRGLWTLHPVGEEVVVAHPDGAVAGPPAEVAAALDRLAAADGPDPLEQQVIQALRPFLAGDRTQTHPGARHWSRPAVAYWISGPRNQPGWHDRKAGSQAAHPQPIHDDQVRPARVQPARPKVTPEPALQPAA